MSNTKKSATTPLLRFPQFRDGPAWNVEPMETLYAFGRTNSLSRAQLNSLSGAVKNVHYGDIHTKYPSSLDLATVDVPYINGKEALPEPTSGDYCVEGDLIFADASEDTKDVGKCVEVVRLHGQRLLSGQHTILARRKKPSPIVGFGGHLFQSRQIRSQIEREAQGTKVYSISPSRLASIKIAFPGDIGEQEKITDCLASLEAVIAAQGRKVTAMKTYKRGMIQQLFPIAGEAIPRLRFARFTTPWQTRPLSDLLAERKQRNRSLTFGPGEVLSVSGEFGCVNQIALLGRSYAGVSVKEYHVVETGDLVYTKSPLKKNPYGIIKANKGTPGIVSTLYAVYRPTSLSVPAYLDHYFSRDFHVNSYLQPIVRKGAKNDMKVNNEAVLTGEITVPIVAEQAAIADFLDSIDATISMGQRAYSVLVEHKRALMHMLFPTAEKN